MVVNPEMHKCFRDYSCFLHRICNKAQHSTAGNTMTYTDNIAILQVNTGNGKARGNNMILRILASKEKPDIIIVSDSNVDINEPEETSRWVALFHEYKHKDKHSMGTPQEGSQ